LKTLLKSLREGTRVQAAGLPEGLDALALGALALEGGPPVLHVARDDVRLARLAEAVAFTAPHVEILEFPAWDCVPYDRVSPNVEVVARRLDTLSRLAEPPGKGIRPARLILTTVSAVLQRVPPREVIARSVFAARVGGALDTDALMNSPCAVESSISSRRAWSSRCAWTCSATSWTACAASIRSRNGQRETSRN
jgi:transcription-repair coupling factor (superfamily II helicase)